MYRKEKKGEQSGISWFRRRLFRRLLLSGLLFSAGCSWQPKIFHPTVSQTGKVLDKGQTELGIYTFLYVPANIALARGFSKGIELRGAFGLVGNDIGGGELTLIKREIGVRS